jgi:hypothetical protein
VVTDVMVEELVRAVFAAPVFDPPLPDPGGIIEQYLAARCDPDHRRRAAYWLGALARQVFAFSKSEGAG